MLCSISANAAALLARCLDGLALSDSMPLFIRLLELYMNRPDAVKKFARMLIVDSETPNIAASLCIYKCTCDNIFLI